MSLRRGRDCSWIGHPNQDRGVQRRVVETTTSCCRAETLPVISSSAGYLEHLPSGRAGHDHLVPNVALASSLNQVSSSLNGISSSASIRTSSAQVPYSFRDAWSSLSEVPARAPPPTSSLFSAPEDAGPIRTRSPEDGLGSQTTAGFLRPPRKPSNRDEFDGPHQLLNLPSPRTVAAKEQFFPALPVSLNVEEQGDILGKVHEVLSKCAFDFIARYQFPIPIEPGKRLVITPQDREWTEWAYLIKRLATKRRIPARVLYENQIKHLVTVLENSLEPPYSGTNQERPLRDDRNVLQLISAGTQVAKLLKDAAAMGYLDRLYIQTARYIQDRRWTGLPI